MKISIHGPLERKESRALFLRLADAVGKSQEVVNRNGDDLITGDLYNAEKADAFVIRMDQYDDATWAVIGMARAGNRPIIPYWGAIYDTKGFYGFQKDIQDRNKHLVHQDDERPWPSDSIEGVVEDLKILEQRDGWRDARVTKPTARTVDLSLPPYIVGDSRCKENTWSFYDIERGFNECGIDVLIPPRVLDGDYSVDEYPKLIHLDESSHESGVQACADLASFRSSFIIGRADQKSLLGSRWEEGVGWFHSKPILYLYQYVFPPRRPFERYRAGKEPGMHFDSVYRQNKEVWDIREHEGLTPEGIAGVIMRARHMHGVHHGS